MTMIRRAVVAGGVVAGLAGAFVAGAVTNRPSRAEAGPQAPAAQDPVAGVGGLKVPEVLPPAGPGPAAEAIKEPADVLAGVKPVPAEVLRMPPPAKAPEFVVPDLADVKK